MAATATALLRIASELDQQLLSAAMRGDIDEVLRLASKGADINAKGEEGHGVLYWRILCGSDVQLERLITAGADPNIRDDDGWSPLHEATFGNRRGMTKLLLKHGANRDAKDNDGRTPLDYARAYKMHALVRMLSGRSRAGGREVD